MRMCSDTTSHCASLRESGERVLWQCPQFCAHMIAPLWGAAGDFCVAAAVSVFFPSPGVEQPVSTNPNPSSARTALAANILVFNFITQFFLFQNPAANCSITPLCRSALGPL